MVLKNLKTVSFVALLAHAEFVNAGQARRDAVVKKDFEHLVSFGDSYTAEPSTNSTSTSTGGRIWPRMVADAAGAALHDYARSGATCTNEYRSPGNSASSTSILDDELPKFKSAWADANDTVSASLDPSTTVYSIWIGTNDLGYNAFINAGNPPGYNITSVVDCIWTAMDELYALGANYFVLMNTAPLQLSPEYGLPDAGGVGDNEYWALKTQQNVTLTSYMMLEFTVSVNFMLAHGTPFELLVQNRWPDATIALFDVHRLMTDINENGAAYLDSPANVTGSYKSCGPDKTCTTSSEAKSSFLWYDELHPSERTDEIIASSFVDVVKYGNSTYGSYFTGSNVE